MPTGGSSRQTVMIVDGDTVRSRRLSAREAARLMGLPDNYKLPSNYIEAYDLMGDGVVVPAVRHLAEGARSWSRSRRERLRTPKEAQESPSSPSAAQEGHPAREGAQGAARGRLTMPRSAASPPIPFAWLKARLKRDKAAPTGFVGSSAPWAISRPAVTPGRGIGLFRQDGRNERRR